LSAPDQTDISEAARELTNIAATEEYEGKKQEWSGILEGELAKRGISKETTGSSFAHRAGRVRHVSAIAADWAKLTRCSCCSRHPTEY
jgi:hypothetical protein